MSIPRVALSGYYGFSNAGDEAVLAGLVQSLRALRSPEELEITALSINPTETYSARGILVAHRYKSGPLLRTLSRTDLLLSGGGSLLQDVTSAHGIFYYLAVVRIAQILRKKTMFIAQGIGPLRRKRSRKLVASVANRLSAITVRDPDSAELLRTIGVKRPIEVTADPALLLAPTQPASPPKGERFAVALRPWPGDGSLASTLAEVCTDVFLEARALLVPMQPGPDKPIAEQFAQKWHQANQARLSFCPVGTDLSQLMLNFASCSLVIGMRLHALILATACGLPSVALAYDPKVSAFMTQAGQSDAVYDLSHPDREALILMLAKAWAERSERAAAVQAILPQLRAAAARNAQVAVDLLA